MSEKVNMAVAMIGELMGTYREIEALEALDCASGGVDYARLRGEIARAIEKAMRHPKIQQDLTTHVRHEIEDLLDAVEALDQD